MDNQYLVKQWEIAKSSNYDLVVVGGGSAGVAAAVAAAQRGVSVLLIEQNGVLGGASTACLVGPFMTCYDTHGERPVVGGVFRILIDSLIAVDAAIEPDIIPGGTAFSSFIYEGHSNVTPFLAHQLVNVLFDMMERYHVDTLLHTKFIDVIKSGSKIDGVVVHRKQGLTFIPCKYVIDCTGDGDVSAAADAQFSLGRDDGHMQPATVFFRLGNVDDVKLENWAKEHRKLHGSEQLFQCIVAEASKDDRFPVPREWINIYREPIPGQYRVNCTRVVGIDGTKSEELTIAEVQGRRQVRDLLDFLRDHCPGFEKAVLLEVASQVGIRETRHIIGDYVLTRDDVVGCRRFDDSIGRYSFPVDIHDPVGTGGDFGLLSGDYYDVPVGVLRVKGFSNLLVAGRCISADHDAHASVRVMPACYMTGEAAGTLAGLAIVSGVEDTRYVNIKELQRTLRGQGAIV